MGKITKIVAGVFGIICLVATAQVNAQWTTIKAPVRGNDLMRISGQSFQNYKGIESGTFEIIASVTEVKEKGKVNFQLRTQSITMVGYDSYVYRPYLKVKDCSGIEGKMQEREWSSNFHPMDIGARPFEQAMRSANATFDVEITFFVKDEKYGKGYRAIRIFKNVKANGVFWADEPIETTAEIEDIKILNHPKLVSFKSDDSGIQAAIENFIKEKNKQAEDQCREKTKAIEADQLKKEEENKKAEASANEIESIKNKLQSQINITGAAAKTGKAKEDDFWAGGKEKGANSDDFWSGGGNKSAAKEGGNDIEAIDKGGRIYLKDASNIIKEWSSDEYYTISRLQGSDDFFILTKRSQGTGFLSQNRLVIIDRQGNTVRIDNEEYFGKITPREDGGYALTKYLSESHYKGSEERSPKVKDWYTSASEAISDVEKELGRIRKEIIEERRKRGDKPGTVYLVSTYNCNVVQAKEVITNSSMQFLISKTGYKVVQ